MIPTAEEMFEANPILPPGVARNACIAFMKTFAKLHVKAALKEASEKAKTKKIYRGTDSSMLVKKVIDKESILNAYPLTNIV